MLAALGKARKGSGWGTDGVMDLGVRGGGQVAGPGGVARTQSPYGGDWGGREGAGGSSQPMDIKKDMRRAPPTPSGGKGSANPRSYSMSVMPQSSTQLMMAAASSSGQRSSSSSSLPTKYQVSAAELEAWLGLVGERLSDYLGAVDESEMESMLADLGIEVESEHSQY